MASGKRQATTELNHDNWNQDEEPEERGSFRTAPQDELKNRVIKKARRHLGSDTADGSSAPKSVFSGFSGFGKAAASTGSTSAGASPFSFLSKIPAVSVSSSSNISGANAVTAAATFSFGAATSTTNAKAEKDAQTKKTANEPEKNCKSDNYYAKLKGLNQADYTKILTEIDKDESIKTMANTGSAFNTVGSKGTSDTNALSTFKFSDTLTASTAISNVGAATPFSFNTSSTSPFAPSTTNATTKHTNIFGGISKPTSSAELPKSDGFSFGLKTNDKAGSSSIAKVANTSDFSFGKPTAPVDGKKTTGFSFTTGTASFSFGNIKPPAAVVPAANTGKEDEEDQPPKVEFKQVVEDGAIYSKKCKVFVKKDGNFIERGVGTLYLKPVKDAEKTQLLVRADTNLGNILVNLILSSAIPAKRMGKNNVMLVCLPTPDVEKPTSMLLRVKTGDEADELFETIEKHKK